MGLAIPFMITAYSITFFFKWFEKLKNKMNIIEWMAGLLLIIIGLLMITGSLTRIAAMLNFFSAFSK
jgi:cytochrome c-type biogenesis protein